MPSPTEPVPGAAGASRQPEPSSSARAAASPGRSPATGSSTVRPPAANAHGRLPLRALTVLYDPQCRLCAFVARWLRRQRKLIPLTLVPVGSAQARARFPDLDHDGATRREVTAVGDAGQVYIGDSAWLVCLWALAGHRSLAYRFSTPVGRRLARAAVLTAAGYRKLGSGGGCDDGCAVPYG